MTAVLYPVRRLKIPTHPSFPLKAYQPIIPTKLYSIAKISRYVLPNATRHRLGNGRKCVGKFLSTHQGVAKKRLFYYTLMIKLTIGFIGDDGLPLS